MDKEKIEILNTEVQTQFIDFMFRVEWLLRSNYPIKQKIAIFDKAFCMKYDKIDDLFEDYSRKL